MVTQLGCVSETAIDSKAGSGLTIKKPLEEFPKGHHAGSAYSVMMGKQAWKNLADVDLQGLRGAVFQVCI